MKYNPMLLTEVKGELPQGDEWSYEAKLDGQRLLAEVSGSNTVLFNRAGNEITDKFPVVQFELPEALSGRRAVVDGEIIGLNKEGDLNFGVLRRKRPDARLFIFDLLELDGKPLVKKSLEYRRNQLTEIFDPQETIKRFSVFIDRDSIVEGAGKLCLEGVIAKRNESLYSPGLRSKDWLKLVLKRNARKRK